ncbi:hypothetical protein [Actinomadura bangladeshensis]|uniref:Uncharacterized protein n=1 Tax=Actinomadura bangladeshensis TaxID=453573 RepID=A0A6L9QH86_9ACTN|nr:hypothetical protein [Actinomadura bangladeshensis]NEA24635.1 hypothetical protein [Actinomadura bangladeshensis]
MTKHAAELSAADMGNVVQAENVSGGVRVHRPLEDAPRSRQLPGDVNGFVNRTSELARLDRALRRPVTLVVGTVGVGKTSLEVHRAHARRDRFPDGRLYADLRGHAPGEPATAVHVLEGFLPALGVAREVIPGDVDRCASLYRSLLAGRRMLIVLDNATSPAQVRPLLPGAPGCAVVATGAGACPVSSRGTAPNRPRFGCRQSGRRGRCCATPARVPPGRHGPAGGAGVGVRAPTADPADRRRTHHRPLLDTAHRGDRGTERRVRSARNTARRDGAARSAARSRHSRLLRSYAMDRFTREDQRTGAAARHGGCASTWGSTRSRTG